MKDIKPISKVFWNLLLIFSGSVLCAVAIKGILIPSQLLAGVFIFSAVIFWPDPILPIQDMILSAITAGIITGVGAGITFTELSRFKEMIRKIDPNAFVVVTETLAVLGKRIGNQPHW